MKDIVLLGLGGHAHSVVDSMEQAGNYNIIVFWIPKKCRENGIKIIVYWIQMMHCKSILTVE